MINLKALGLAIVLALAMSAFAASSASALGEFTVEGGGTESIATEDVGEPDVFTVSGNELTCSAEKFTGSLTNSAPELTVTPEYKDCKTAGSSFNNITVTHNECHFDFYITKTMVTDEDTGGVYIDCPEKKAIEIHHYSTHHNHTTGISSCTNTVDTQTAEGELTYTSLTASKDVLVEGDVTVDVTTHGGCSFGFTLTVNSEYHASTTVKGAAGKRVHVG